VIGVRGLRLAIGDGTDVAAAIHRPVAPPRAARPAVLLLPGARGDHSAAHLVAIAEVLAEHGHVVVRSALSPRPPGSGVVGPAERSVGRLVDILRAARAHVDDGCPHPWIVGGASYGGRVASLAVADHGGAALGVAGLLLVAYPLHPPGRPDRLRTAHWPRLDVPVLILSGDRDPFLTEELLVAGLAVIAPPVTRITVAGARHDLAVSARSAPDDRRRTPGEAVRQHAAELGSWAATCVVDRGDGAVPGADPVGH